MSKPLDGIRDAIRNRAEAEGVPVGVVLAEVCRGLDEPLPCPAPDAEVEALLLYMKQCIDDAAEDCNSFTEVDVEVLEKILATVRAELEREQWRDVEVDGLPDDVVDVEVRHAAMMMQGRWFVTGQPTHWRTLPGPGGDGRDVPQSSGSDTDER